MAWLRLAVMGRPGGVEIEVEVEVAVGVGGSWPGVVQGQERFVDGPRYRSSTVVVLVLVA